MKNSALPTEYTDLYQKNENKPIGNLKDNSTETNTNSGDPDNLKEQRSKS